MSTRRLPPGHASQETLVSLLQLDPMPVPESPDTTSAPANTDKDLPPLPRDAAADRDRTGPAEKPSSPADRVKKHSHSRSLSESVSHAVASVGLHTGHGAVFYLTRIQRYSSYAFTIFTSVHLATTSLIPLASRSVPASEAYLLLAREIYQTRLSEPLLVTIPVVAHVAAGLGLRLIRRRQNLRRYGGATPGVHPVASRREAIAQGHRETQREPTWWARAVEAVASLGRRLTSGWPPLTVTSVSGYVFAATLAGHVFANRWLPLQVEGDSSDIGLAYIAHGFARHPATSWAAYTLFLGAASGHIVWGWARWLRVSQHAAWTATLSGRSGSSVSSDAVSNKALRRRRRHTWLAVQGCVLVTFVLWASGGLGVVARGGATKGWVAKIYDGLYSKMGL